MSPTDFIRATHHYGDHTLVLHRADGDTVTIALPPAASIRDVMDLVREKHDDLPLEVKCNTIFGLLE